MENTLNSKYEELYQDFKKKFEEMMNIYKSGGEGLTEKHKEVRDAWQKIDEIVQKIISK